MDKYVIIIISTLLTGMFLLFSSFLMGIAAIESEDCCDLAMQNPHLFEGDILERSDGFLKRSLVSYPELRWPEGKVPYVIDKNLSHLADQVRNGMEEFHNKTCIRFVPRKNEEDYVNIFSGEGCYSAVGRYTGKQSLSLGGGCHYYGAIIHELGHTVGLIHEHSRIDRDDYLIIHWENVKEEEKFKLETQPCYRQILYNLFDYDSIMMIGPTHFSKNGTSQTLEAKSKVKLQYVQFKKGLSKADAERINLAYNCLGYIES